MKEGLPVQVQMQPNWSHDAKKEEGAESGGGKSPDPVPADPLNISLEIHPAEPC